MRKKMYRFERNRRIVVVQSKAQSSMRSDGEKWVGQDWGLGKPRHRYQDKQPYRTRIGPIIVESLSGIIPDISREVATPRSLF